MRQYRIWNNIHTVGGRKSSADYGASERDSRTIFVGTSSRDSHEFARVETTCDVLDDGALQFSLWVDGRLIKRGIVDRGEYGQTVNNAAELY